MLVLEVLRAIQLGNSVAEFDQHLEKYFIETETFRRIAAGEVDLIAGDKGTGKTALFRILRSRYRSIEALNDVEVIPAFNPEGAPVFQRLNEGLPLEEGQYITLWKSYFFSLAGNWILAIYEGNWTPSMRRLAEMLEQTGLSSADDSPTTVFSSIVNLFRRLMHPVSAEALFTVGPHGMPIVVPRVEFAGVQREDPPAYIPHDDAFSLLSDVLQEENLSLWLVMDRLDEAFAGTPAAEIPALRALMRTYLDLLPYGRIKLKLFVRKDLFRRITAGGFVNLTHINARKIEIMWDDESLRHLLYLRLRENATFLEAAGLEPDDQDGIFNALFPAQVDPGNRKPTTFRWIMGRIRDGNDVKPPRNLIDLVQKSLDAAKRKEERERNEYVRGRPLLAAESLKSGLGALSKQRVEDTLLAEVGEQSFIVERFRSGKAEQNAASITELLHGLPLDGVDPVRFLVDAGFLEPSGTNYKVPMLYREGLGITQGKAFDSGEPAESDDDE